MEAEFQLRYYERIRPTLQFLALLFVIMFAVYTVRDYSDTQSFVLSGTQDGAPAVFFLLLFGLTWLPGLGHIWQTVIVAGGLVTTFISLSGLAYFLAASHSGDAPTSGLGSVFSSESLFFGQHMRLLMVCFSAS